MGPKSQVVIAKLARKRHIDLALAIAKSYGHIFSKKNQWVTLSPRTVQKYPELADVFFSLVNEAYKNIGGHLKFSSPRDFMQGEISIIKAIDLDGDQKPDAIKMGKKKSPGLKSVGIGHDGSKQAKKAVLDEHAKDMKSNYYSEMSDALAHIMITRHNVPSVNSQEAVERVLGKRVEWVGPHPEGKYPKHQGWYYRKIAGKTKLKILLGSPRL